MKRLRVVLVCLIVALLCWNPSHHVYCSEQSLSGPGQSAGHTDPDENDHKQDLTQQKVEEERTIHTLYKVGLETESAALEEPTAHNETPDQNVNTIDAEAEETGPEPELDPQPVTAEPEPLPDLQNDVTPQPVSQDEPQDVPESPSDLVLATVHMPSEAPPAAADTPSDSELIDPPIPHPAQSTPPHEAENMPTSEIGTPPPPNSAERVASEGDDLPVDSFVFAELSDSQCRVNAPELATCENLPFGSPVLSVDEAGVGDEREQTSETKSEVPPAPGPEGPEPQQQESDTGLSEHHPEANSSQTPTEQKAGDASIARETDPSVPTKEDIPTFDEWKKQVMEVEKEKSQSLHTSTSSSSHPVKKVQSKFKNNYASVECGAKILSANSEAKSTSAILKENMDLYMLNPCSTKIWFVIELCEPIQVKQLDIANFELFSSTPKDFLVSLSDRYPTNKWVKLGTFHARDKRTVQSFPLDEQLYAKYVKVELLSHFGSEHFCPLSLIRVFGTSMVEEYEEIADSQDPSERVDFLDEDYDYPPGYQPSEDKASKNLLGSATNAILNMVNNIAANVLGGGPEMEGGTENGNASIEAQNEVDGSKEVSSQHNESIQPSAILEPGQSGHPEEKMNLTQSSTPPLTPPEPVEERQIVTLVEEEEEEEEPQRSTVTLMEEEIEEEEETREEQGRKEAGRNQWESQAYCPFSSFTSLSLSCMATLPELLHRWCSARLTKERLRSVRRRNHSHTHSSSSSTHTPALVPITPPSQDILTVTEIVPEPETHESKVTNDVLTTEINDTHTPDFNLLLEPSQTSSIPPQSFSDSHSSLTRPTPTNEDKVLSPVKDSALDPLPTPPLQAVSIPETQQASRATPTPILNSTPQSVAPEAPSSAFAPSVKEQPIQPLPTASRPEDMIAPPTGLPSHILTTDLHTDADKADQSSQSHGEHGDSITQNGEAHHNDHTVEDDLLNSVGNGNGHRTATDFYAELQNGGDYSGGPVNGNGGAVHGSSQKESVFMRLNNRIKALEMNMSLSSRYLEELSQRYRKQMEEMQRAFNKTIIKLQNTSRIAEEQDQKQTESIQILQSQLENVTKVMLNLTFTVSQLQREVSDRQSYLVVSLVLCLFLGVLLCMQCCRSSPPSPNISTVALPKSNHYPSPKRCFSSYDDMSIKRRVACPLVRSKSFHLSSTEVGPDDLYIVEPLRFSPEKKKKRGKTKSLDKVETLNADHPTPLTNGILKCNGFHPALPAPVVPPALPAPPPAPLALPPSSVEEVLLLPSCPTTESPSESTSCSSSHSEESYTSRLPPPSPVLPPNGLCNGHSLPFTLHQPSKTRQEKRSMKRRKSKQTELPFPSLPTGGVSSLPSLQTLIKGNKDISVGTIGVTAVTGHV
ncbi:SUN domain-containing ossification factor isoform X2 [Periophthalmus magnuspinnatus]|uniref:SUN domain-containing ossification factor isoform X2 n=1 Tax=Periophthalmus magnuspinnatus TaxID=409849 RepID=UPI00145B184C|nr:SUN domain-containing ossification factor isoform X2 [Periophthalmus magnuspinnatus]